MNTPPKFVEVYDLVTQSITTIPAAELAPGMIEAEISHLHKTCWIQASALSQGDWQSSSFRHPKFGADERHQIRQIREQLQEIYPQSFNEWEEGFRRDENPAQEISHWLHLSGTYVELVGRWSLTGSQRRELFRLLVQCSLTSYPHVLETVDAKRLPAGFAQQAIEAFYGRAILNADPVHEYLDPFGGTPLPIKSLEGSSVRDELVDASIVFGVDVSTGDSALFFGKGSLAEVTLSGDPSREEIISFLYDGRTEELEWLYAAVRVLKGSCCYDDATQDQ